MIGLTAVAKNAAAVVKLVLKTAFAQRHIEYLSLIFRLSK